MTWHRIFGVFVLVALLGVLLRPGTAVGVAQAFDAQAPVVATPTTAGVPVVVRSGGASLLDNPNGAAVRQLETGTIVQALSRTPTGDWIFVEVEAGVQGWQASSSLVSVNPASLPVYGRPQAEQFNRPAQATAIPVEEPSPTPEPTATSTATAAATQTPTATASATPTAVSTATATALPATATPLPTSAPTATAQPSTSTAQNETAAPIPTAQPVRTSATDTFLRTVGVVRAGGASLLDGPSGGVVAILPAGEIVTLLQRSPDDSWLEVVRTGSGTGWVARTELLSASLTRVPRVGDAKPSPIPSPAAPIVSESAAPTVQSPSGDAPRLATVRTDGSRLNVRSGPGANFPIVAKADNDSSYPVLAVDGDAWVQIEIADAPEGSGWVAARFVTLGGELGE